MPDPEPAKTLAEALVQLQAQLPRVAKGQEARVETKTGGTYKYAYADLTDVSAVLLPLLASCGLAFTACPTLTLDYDKFVLDYQLIHVSGEKVGGFYPLPMSGTPQQIGSAITYAKRYALCAVTGLAPGGDDDDSQAAEPPPLRQPVSAQDKQRAKTSRLQAGTSRMARAQEEDPWAQDAPVDGQRAAGLREDGEHRPGSSHKGQWQQLAILYGQISLTDREMRLADLTDRAGREITSAKDLSYAEAEQAIRSLRELAPKEEAKLCHHLVRTAAKAG